MQFILAVTNDFQYIYKVGLFAINFEFKTCVQYWTILQNKVTVVENGAILEEGATHEQIHNYAVNHT